MAKKCVIITVCVIAGLVLAAGLGVLIWWLVTRSSDFTTIRLPSLEGSELGIVSSTAAFTRIRNAGDMFWWFIPTTAASATLQPIILWLDGVTGLPPSMLANFGMFGPYDFNLTVRSDSWVTNYNLLFVDAPLGTGFSTIESDLPRTLDENVDHLVFALQSFYSMHDEYEGAPLYIIAQGDGAQLAVELTLRLAQNDYFNHKLTDIVIGGGIISPALVFTKLGFYLEELGYIDGNGRDAIEALSTDVNTLVDSGNLSAAFDRFLGLGEYVNNNAAAVAVNVKHIIEKLTNDPSRDAFGQRQYLREVSRSVQDQFEFMDSVVAPLLDISRSYDSQRDQALEVFREFFMESSVNKVENILENTDIRVTIFNGNLDAVSNTPGQLEWVNNLQWSGQQSFLNSTRIPLVVSLQLEGYVRETDRLRFYWINVAGQSVPLDNPVAMDRLLQRITN